MKGVLLPGPVQFLFSNGFAQVSAPASLSVLGQIEKGVLLPGPVCRFFGWTHLHGRISLIYVMLRRLSKCYSNGGLELFGWEMLQALQIILGTYFSDTY